MALTPFMPGILQQGFARFKIISLVVRILTMQLYTICGYCVILGCNKAMIETKMIHIMEIRV